MTDKIAAILTQRHAVHGPFELDAHFSQCLKQILYSDVGGYSSLSDPQREALGMITTKIGRILAGDPNHVDHWEDIAGYATLVANILRTA